MSLSKVIDALHYRRENLWLGIPEWTKYFAELGTQSVAASETDAKLVVGMAVPCRSYAATFIALGVIIARANIATVDVSSVDHFAQVCALPLNSPVSVTVIGKGGSQLRKKGVFGGLTQHNGCLCAKIMVNSKSGGGGSHLIREVDANRIEILASDPIELPKKQTGKLIRGISAFAKSFLHTKSARLSTKQSRLECAIVGRIKTLSDEIEATRFAIPSDEGKYYEGTLQDLVRVRRFGNEGDHFASDIIRLNGRSVTIGGDGELPPFVIFDGAAGFIRWHGQLRSSNWIVVLDRTESRFREAAEVLNEGYLNRILEDKELALPTPPEAIEAMTFYERW